MTAAAQNQSKPRDGNTSSSDAAARGVCLCVCVYAGAVGQALERSLKKRRKTIERNRQEMETLRESTVLTEAER